MNAEVRANRRPVAREMTKVETAKMMNKSRGGPARAV
jgi:hypothetical protein